ncbi:MAG: hypothetical protein IT580_03835 [Verrucomicrobiales bacterium]|nr:hypothetical protein [Verrucomicrobiales bacterium]
MSRLRPVIYGAFLLATVGSAILVSKPKGGAAPVAKVREAMVESARYMVRHLDGTGRFDYLNYVDGRPERGPERYNVLRHAGSIYALAQYQDRSPDPLVRDAILRGAGYLLRRHVQPIPGKNGVLGIASLPGEEVTGKQAEFKLGGTALGLVALVKAWQLDHASVPPEVLRGLGRFLLEAQDGEGRFTSRFDARGVALKGGDSAYYPGEAALALACLHRVDPDPKWLAGAKRGIGYLVRRRGGTEGAALPDHWLMLAASEVYGRTEAGTATDPERDAAVAHCLGIARGMMREQQKTSTTRGLAGAFGRSGAVAPTATRLEGLIALHRLLPAEHPERAALRTSIENGLGFLMRGQVAEGSTRGGFTRVFPREAVKADAGVRRSTAHHEIRIDYVQHALSAMVTYESGLPAEGKAPRWLPAMSVVR